MKRLLLLSTLVIIVTIWWWVESYKSCEDQDEYSLRGACLIKIKNAAQKEEVGAQWTYAGYLFTQGKTDQSKIWYQKALENSKIGTDLWEIVGYCDKRPGLHHQIIESKLQKVSIQSKDANLLLLILYTTEDCGAFNLEKATAVIPNLEQCANLTLSDYIRISRQRQFRISSETIDSINKNINICQKEISTHPKKVGLVAEIVPPQEDSLQKLRALLNSSK